MLVALRCYARCCLQAKANEQCLKLRAKRIGIDLVADGVDFQLKRERTANSTSFWTISQIVSRVSQLHAAPHAPCEMLYLITYWCPC